MAALLVSVILILSIAPALALAPVASAGGHKTSTTSSSSTTTTTTTTASSTTSSSTSSVGTSATFAIAVTQSYYAEDVQQTADGGYVVGADNAPNGVYVAQVVKLDPFGNLQWTNEYQVNGFHTHLYALRQTSDGGYVFAGDLQNSSSSSCADCALVVKLSSSGGVQWQKTYSAGAQANDIELTADGGYVIVGFTPQGNTLPQPPTNVWIAKLDPSGNAQWQQALGSSVSAQAYSVQQTSDGGYVLAGYSGQSGILVVKLDSSGNVNWQTTYSAPIPTGSLNGDFGYSVIQTSDGGYLVAGKVNTQLAEGLKLSSSGGLQWAKAYAESGTTSQFSSVLQTSDGSLVFAGYLDNASMYEPYSSWLVKTDSSGNVLWQKTYGATGEDRQFQGVALTSDGGFVATGWTLQYGGGQLEIYVVRTDSSGNINTCADVQSTTGSASGLSVSRSSAGLSVTVPPDASSASVVSTVAVSMTLSREC